MRRTATVLACLSTLVMGCSTRTDIAQRPSTAAASTSATVTAAPPTSARPTPTATTAAPARLGICPQNPPRNGPLSDQGEVTGRVGVSSATYNDEAGQRLYCAAVTKIERARNGVIVTVMLVNQSGRLLDFDGDDAVDLPVLTYGSAGAEAERVSSFSEGDRGNTYLTGVVPPAARRTAEYAFTVPAGRQPVTVSMLSFAWTGTLT